MVIKLFNKGADRDWWPLHFYRDELGAGEFPSLLRQIQQSFCLNSLTSLCGQYEISVEQLVLTELDSVLKVKNPSLIITINTSIKLELLVQSSSLLLTVGSSCHCQWKEAT